MRVINYVYMLSVTLALVALSPKSYNLIVASGDDIDGNTLDPRPALGRLTFVTKKDNDHSDIELDKLNNYNQYDMVPETTGPTGNRAQISKSDFIDLTDLFHSILEAPSVYREPRYENGAMFEQKRFGRQMVDGKEDKDYSFVSSPVSSFDSFVINNMRHHRNQPKMIGYSFRAPDYSQLGSNAFGNKNRQRDSLAKLSIRSVVDGSPRGEQQFNDVYSRGR